MPASVTWLCQEAIKNVLIAFPPEQILFIYCAVTVLIEEELCRMISFFLTCGGWGGGGVLSHVRLSHGRYRKAARHFMVFYLSVESMRRYSLVWIHVRAGGETGFGFFLSSLMMHPSDAVCSLKTVQRCKNFFLHLHTQHMAALPHEAKRAQKNPCACCWTQALVSRCQGRLSASVTQCCCRVGVEFPSFSCANLSAQETTRGGGGGGGCVGVFSVGSRWTQTQRF